MLSEEFVSLSVETKKTADATHHHVKVHGQAIQMALYFLVIDDCMQDRRGRVQ